MNEDLNIFEKELKARFTDPPLPESLEAGRVAEALKKPREPIKLAPAPWKRALRIAAAVVLVAGAAIISVLAIRQRAGNSIKTEENAGDGFFTQSTVSSDEASGAGAEAEAGVIEAPEDAPAQPELTDSGAVLTVASEKSGVPMPTGLDEAVSAAIITSNSGESDNASFTTEAHRVLGSADSEAAIVVYAEVVYTEYALGGGAAATLTVNSSMPAAISFDKHEGSYTLAEYWIPAETDYEASVREKFPEQIAEEALAMSAASELLAECDAEAAAYFEENAAS